MTNRVPLTFNGGPIPEGAKLQPVEGYALLRYRAPNLVEQKPIIGFLLRSDNMILGVAQGQQDNTGPTDDNCAVRQPDGSTFWGGKKWPNTAAWLNHITKRNFPEIL